MQNKFLNQIMNILAMKFTKNISELRVKFINASLETMSVGSELNPRTDSSSSIVLVAPFVLIMYDGFPRKCYVLMFPKGVHFAVLCKSHVLLLPKGEHSRHSRTMLGLQR